MGSSSERNCEARKRVPVDGLSPNWTICRSETPEDVLTTAFLAACADVHLLLGSYCSAIELSTWKAREKASRRTLMVSISLSLRFHDMMPIVQGRTASIAACRPEVDKGSHVELPP